MNIGIITQARTTSSRLPAKILLKVQGKTLFEHHLSRLEASALGVYVATTVNEQDDVLTKICRKKKILMYRGSEHDVLSRFYQCALQYNIDIIIRATSDCPLTDAQVILNGLNLYLSKYQVGKKLYLSNTRERTFPKGMDFEIFSFDMLKEAHENAIEKAEREHVTPYFYQNHKGDIELINYSNIRDTSHLRITLDFKKDYNFIKTLIEKHNAHNLQVASIEDIILNSKELIKLNNLCRQTAQLIN